MSKAILVSNRQGKDKQTNGDVLWLNLYILPRHYKKNDGSEGLYHRKKEEALVTVCVQKEFKPDDYNKLKDVREGAICVLKYVLDQNSDRAKLDTVDVLPGTANKFTYDQLYKE